MTLLLVAQLAEDAVVATLVVYTPAPPGVPETNEAMVVPLGTPDPVITSPIEMYPVVAVTVNVVAGDPLAVAVKLAPIDAVTLASVGSVALSAELISDAALE
jgi:hypothetical protein